MKPTIGMLDRLARQNPLAAIRRRTGPTWGEHCAGVLPPKRKPHPKVGGR